MPRVKGDDGTSSGRNYSQSGVWGDVYKGLGVTGSVASGWGVLGTSVPYRGSGPWLPYPSRAGVSGHSDVGVGVYGKSDSDVGVRGASSYGTAIEADGYRGVGVSSRALSIGVDTAPEWRESPGDFIGVLAEAGPEGIAGYFANATLHLGHGPRPASIFQRVDFGLAGHFYGNVEVVGSLSKSGGGFRIDHPLDPGRRYLSHSFVESSDMKNIYDGTVRLDRTGAAVVKLPRWCAALNRNFRYQLTPIGGPAPNLHIAEEIRRDQFRIAGGRPGARVSWQVTGIRQDAWANANRITVEERKNRTERGHYLHPELVRKPVRRNIVWARYPEKMKALEKERTQRETRLRDELRRDERRRASKRGRRARGRSVRRSR